MKLRFKALITQVSATPEEKSRCTILSRTAFKLVCKFLFKSHSTQMG